MAEQELDRLEEETKLASKKKQLAEEVAAAGASLDPMQQMEAQAAEGV